MLKPAAVLASLALASSCFTAAAQSEAPRLSVTTSITPTAAADPTANTVGISSREGLTLSGTDVLITRNGVSEKLLKES